MLCFRLRYLSAYLCEESNWGVLFTKKLLIIIVYMCVVCVGRVAHVCAEVRGQLLGVRSLLLLWGLEMDH